MMQYISTRGHTNPRRFEDILLSGLAPDGGLYLPESLPKFSAEDIKNMADMSYEELAFTIIKPFIDGDIPDDDLKELIDKSYADFRHQERAPLVEIGQGQYVQELFHGPTLAFKDFALQLLGNMMEYVLTKKNQYITIIGATSGDTGSAAIYGVKDCKHVKIFILHPYGNVSDVQRKQMTTILQDNVFNLAIEGNFDDCQDMVKSMFNDPSFIGADTSLAAVNSINWARIMAQIVYYFYAACKLGAPEQKISFSVPTGNFGDIFAGYLAKKMGLPIDKLIIATNSNDILHRFMSENKYEKSGVSPTLSPSMDIQISSNFERLLFDLLEKDGDKVNDLLTRFRQESVSIPEDAFQKAQKTFQSARVGDEMTVATIKSVFDKTGYQLDPHTAIGVKAAEICHKDSDIPVVTLSTAHPAKFPKAAELAGLNTPTLPDHLENLFSLEERLEVLPNDLDKVKEFIVDSV